MSRASTITVALIFLYGVFFTWYTSFRGPLAKEEIEAYMAASAAREGVDAEGLAVLREFLEGDTGDDFVMVNVIEMRNPPQRLEGVGPDESASDVLGRYMEYMWPALIRRACHPVLIGTAAAPALDVWGLEGAERWSQAGLMRYRSRRDLMELALNPAFEGPHEFKIAAMVKTVAFPIDPWFQLGDPRLVLALIFLVVILFLQMMKIRKAASTPTAAGFENLTQTSRSQPIGDI